MLGFFTRKAAYQGNRALLYSGLEQGLQAIASRALSSSAKEMTIRDALNSAHDEEMSADPKVFVIGEEVGEYQGPYKVSISSMVKPSNANFSVLLIHSPFTTRFQKGFWRSMVRRRCWTHPSLSALRAKEDENGVRHILLSRVILGNTEVIAAGLRNWISLVVSMPSSNINSSKYFPDGLDFQLLQRFSEDIELGNNFFPLNVYILAALKHERENGMYKTTSEYRGYCELIISPLFPQYIIGAS
ncbi:Transketolase family protein [Perilla frutescens var. hirtella]|uniref:Pyruvate dehydrogenase E1 component subunit beta n=1 Tax=Perilla frutescens var. hirtella TaxID=608512 RepID=A0AAD4J1X1_PERFH|nr:Transketolase family protein [Perilla frutescens var. hirtella]